MHENDAALRAEFVRESLEIIAHVGSACARIQSSNEASLEREEIDRGLHTLKGNAGALGYDEFSDAACHVLDQLRLRGQRDPRLAKREMSLVLRFITVARQFLFLLSNDRAPGQGFFSHFAAPSRGEPAAAPASPVRDGLADALDDERLAAEIEEILQAVPSLDPDPRRLLRRGRRAPVAVEPETPPPPHPTTASGPDAVVESVESTATPAFAAGLFAGFGFEARQILRSLAAIPEDALAEAWRPHLTAASDFLEELRRATLQTRAVPIEYYLKDMALWGRRMAVSVDDRLDISVLSNGVMVLPGVGDLLCMLLREVLDVTLPLREDDWTGGQPAIQFEAKRTDRLELHICGSPSLQRNTTREKIRLCATLQLLEEIGGALAPGAQTQGVVLSLDDKDLVDVPVVVIGQDARALAVPAHRLVDVVRCKPSEASGEHFERDGIVVPWMPSSFLSGDESTPPRDDAPCHVLVFHTAKGLRGVVVRDEVHRRELLVHPHAGHAKSRTLGFCIAPESGTRIRLLPTPSP